MDETNSSTWLRNKIPVKIKRLHEDAVIPRYAHPGDAGFDLVATEDVIIEPGRTKIVPTGIAVAVPDGYEMQIRPRSGVSSKTKLRIANAPGTVDSPYRGEVGVLIDNIKPRSSEMTVVRGYVYDIKESIVDDLHGKHEVGSYLIRKGDRICQAIIAEAPKAEFIEVDSLDETERGDGGFGSSGVRTNIREAF